MKSSRQPERPSRCWVRANNHSTGFSENTAATVRAVRHQSPRAFLDLKTLPLIRHRAIRHGVGRSL
eukprot:1380486-Pyramimonas_sp.AAC.1